MRNKWMWPVAIALAVCIGWHMVLFTVPTDGMTSTGDLTHGQYHLAYLASPESAWAEQSISIYQTILRVDAYDISAWVARSINPGAAWESSWQVGATHRYVAERRDGDGKRVVNATSQPPSIANLFEHLGFAGLIALVTGCVVLLIGLRYPTSPMVWALALLASGRLVGLAWQSFALPFSYVAIGWPLWGQFALHVIAQGLIFGATVQLALTFIRPLTFYDQHRPVLLAVMYGLYPLGIVIGFGLQPQWIDKLSWSLNWEQQAAILLQGSAYLAWAAQYRRADVMQRGQLHWVLVATAVNDFPRLTGLFAMGDALMPIQMWLGLLPPLAYAMALLPQRRLRIALLPTSGVIHGIANTLMAALFLSALGFVANFLGSQNQQLVPILTIGLAVLFAMSTAPLMVLLREQLDSWFNGTRGAQRALLHQFAAKVSAEIALDKITAAFREALDQGVQPAFAALWLWDSETRALRLIDARRDRRLENVSTVIPLDAEQQRRLLASATFEPTFAPDLQRSFWPDNVPFFGAISLVASPDLIGVCAIGPRIDGGRYSGDALRFFETLTRSATLAFRNAQLISQLEDKIASLRYAYQQVITVQESERQRIAADLHDETLQQLAYAQLISASLKVTDSSSLQALQVLQENITVTERRLREILRGIHPAVLTDLGLIAALKSWLPKPAHVIVALNIEGFDGKRLPDPELEMTLYRLAQECVNNALKHAQAQQITVKVNWESDWVTLEVSDNGVGFEPARHFAALNHAADGTGTTVTSGTSYTNGANGHFGLLNIRERSLAFDGRFSVHSQPNIGTTIRVQIPVTSRSRSQADLRLLQER